MSLGKIAFCAASALLFWMPAQAAETVYEYHIEHPRYGDIGTYRNTIDTDGDHATVKTELHVAVKVLGIVVHREDATRTEEWNGDRMVRFDGVTVTNGKELKLHGEATGNGFALTTPQGVTTVPADVHPSNPWSQRVLDSDMVMGTKTGHVEKVSVKIAPISPVTFDGKQLMLKRYDIYGDQHQSVWLDDAGTPVAFRTVEDGQAIDFVMSGPPVTLARASAN